MTSPPASDLPEPVPAPKPGSAAGDVHGAASPAAPAPESASELTPEEQMERFERELKETDWGHQPC